ncbi:hypothetical protein GCM10022241_01750 [Micrococcus endophyticus]
MALGTRFLAPRTVTSPVSGFPPWIVNSFAMGVSFLSAAEGHGLGDSRPEAGVA